MAVSKMPIQLGDQLLESQSFEILGIDSFSQGVGCHRIIIPHAPNSVVTVIYCHVKNRNTIDWPSTNIRVYVENKKFFSFLQIDYTDLPTELVSTSVLFDYAISVGVSN